MYSAVPIRPHASRRSRAMLLRQVCGNLKLLSVTATSALAGGLPEAPGLYASGFGLNGNPAVLSAWMNPVSMPELPIWFEIHTYAGLPVNTPVPPRICVMPSLVTSQLNPTRGDQSGDAFGSAPVLY